MGENLTCKFEKATTPGPIGAAGDGSRGHDLAQISWSVPLVTPHPASEAQSTTAQVEMKRILLAWSFLLLITADGRAASNDFVTIAPEPSYHAWWLRADFHPFETQVRGIPIRQIRATWCKASEVRKDLFPPDLVPDLERTGGLSFSIDGYFDGSNVRQTALIGVYQACNGERGSFLLIVAHRQGKPPAIRFLHEIPELQFGMLATLPDATIEVFHCMECDHLTRFKWDKAKKRFVRLAPVEE